MSFDASLVSRSMCTLSTLTYHLSSGHGFVMNLSRVECSCIRRRGVTPNFSYLGLLLCVVFGIKPACASVVAPEIFLRGATRGKNACRRG